MKVYIFIAIVTLSTAVAWGEAGLEEKDPFYPGGRPEVKTPAHASSAEVSMATSTWGRDPFNKPFSDNTAVSKEPVRTSAARGKGLTGIIYSPDVRLAIINGETFREGRMVGERKLVDIRMHSVVFMNAAGGQEEEFLEDFSIKK